MMPPEAENARTGSAPHGPAGERQEELTGLPWFRTWRGVYWFVLGCFVLYVVLLTVFSAVFS